jgi:hypothetical protein
MNLLAVITTLIVMFLSSSSVASCSSIFEDKGPVEEGYSIEYRCHNAVLDKKSAAECFNRFFEFKLNKIKGERDVIPQSLLNLYEKVSEHNIIIHNGEYHILRGGYGTPYFMKNGIIYFDHG